MSTTIEAPVILTVRGTLVPKGYDAARTLHNDTAGSEAGIAGARSLGDLSHKVYTPSTRSKQSSARDGELLFIDVWESPKGIFDFFSNPMVQQQGGHLFSSRAADVWMPARGAMSVHLPAPASKNERHVGIVRGPVASPEKAIEIFRAADARSLRDARRRGLLTHDLFIKLNAPGDSSPLELLGLDVWCDFAGMTEHYSDEQAMSPLHGVFSGAPDASVWSQAAGVWSEW